MNRPFLNIVLPSSKLKVTLYNSAQVCTLSSYTRALISFAFTESMLRIFLDASATACSMACSIPFSDNEISSITLLRSSQTI
jgi:hypothetical protein